ncbi:MAG: hypothetical protein KJO79_08890 [Verrucomicrobiae bacterium]|nr:hypothetical protein [Verrucomicrobiae bacterium]NNJ87284.1 hypothetical protein [Akkermansiaceae bacterium]
MNSTRYMIARLLLSFGLHRKTKRLSEAADEMHLLRLAEEILGEDVWEQAEEIEPLSVEYWSLRKLSMKKEKLDEAVAKAGSILDTSHEERNAILEQTNQACLALEKKRDTLIEHSEVLIADRDRIISEAQRIRRKFDAARTKVQVLSGEPDTTEIIKSERSKLAGYKVEFAALKKKRDEIGEKIHALDEKITQIEAAIAEDRKKLRVEASSAYQSIGKANRDVSKLTAEIGLVEIEMVEHFGEIGRYVSNHAGSDPVCTKICKDHAHLVAQMQSLRSSIALNHKLAAMAAV